MRIAFLLLLLLLLWACGEPRKEISPNPLASEPIILKSEAPELHQYWEFPVQESLWSFELPELPEFRAYRDSLKLLLGDSLLTELIREQAIIVRGKDFGAEKDSLPNWELIHSGRAGKIRPINALEARLLDYQLQRYPMIGHPTEFVAFILKNDSTDMLRVYFSASDTPWPPKWRPASAHYEPALQKGWKMITVLHNHYNDPDENYLGVLAPSKADAHLFKNYGEAFELKEAWITNGFHTVILDGSEFEGFESH